MHGSPMEAGGLEEAGADIHEGAEEHGTKHKEDAIVAGVEGSEGLLEAGLETGLTIFTWANVGRGLPFIVAVTPEEMVMVLISYLIRVNGELRDGSVRRWTTSS
jgi:hypothetical protein